MSNPKIIHFLHTKTSIPPGGSGKKAVRHYLSRQGYFLPKDIDSLWFNPEFRPWFFFSSQNKRLYLDGLSGMPTETDHKRILLATDFSPAASRAAEFTVLFARQLGFEIQLLHIIPEIPGSDDFKQLMQLHPHFREVADRLQNEATRIETTEGIPTGFLMKEGNIFDHIGQAAEETLSKFIVMATHGLSGIQYLTGSFAGKVIARSKVPVCVVQAESEPQPFKNIVIAPDFTRPVLPLLNWALWLSGIFHARIKVVLDQESHLLGSMKLDISFSEFKNLLEDSGRIYKVQTVNATGKEFSRQVLEIARQSEAPLILTELGRKKSRAHFGPEQQLLISNEYQIPVMCLNG